MSNELEQRIDFFIHNQHVFEYGTTTIGKPKFGIINMRSGKMLADYEDHTLGLSLKKGD